MSQSSVSQKRDLLERRFNVPVSPRPRGPTDSYGELLGGENRFIFNGNDVNLWNITKSREMREEPIKEIRCLLLQWAYMYLSKQRIDISMKVAYKRLRDGKKWMDLPKHPPIMLLHYNLKTESQLQELQCDVRSVSRSNVGSLVYNYVECYSKKSLGQARDRDPEDNFLCLKDAPMNVRNDRLFMMFAIYQNSQCIRWAGGNIHYCMPLMTYAVTQNPYALQFMNATCTKDLDLINLAISIESSAFRFAHISLRDTHEFVLRNVEEDGSLLEYASDQKRDDKEIVMAAIKGESHDTDCVLAFASSRLRHDEALVRYAITIQAKSINHASLALRRNEDIAILALQSDPDVFIWIEHIMFCRFPKIVDCAIEVSKGKFVTRTPCRDYVNNSQMIHALELDPSIFIDLPTKDAVYDPFITTVLRKDWMLCRHISEEFLGREHNMIAMIEHDEWFYVSIVDLTAENMPLRLPWKLVENSIQTLLLGIRKDRRVLQEASELTRGQPQLVYEASRVYEDIGEGEIDPLATAQYSWCNMKELSRIMGAMHTNARKKRSKVLLYFLYRFSNVYLTEAIGVSRVFDILQGNIDLFLHVNQKSYSIN